MAARAKCSALLLVGAVVALAAPAAAEPTFWDVVRDPAKRQTTRALVAAERLLLRAGQADFDPELRKNFELAAIATLELEARKASLDPDLRYLLGDLIMRMQLPRESEARAYLESALAEAPDSPYAARAWFSLAIASAKLGDPKREHEAYTRALEVAWQPELRATIYLNRAESSMVLGNLPAALADYREAARLSSDGEHLALALFGLGIAQERSGDLPSALASMKRAAAIRVLGVPSGLALDSPQVFFVPWYDAFYYKALVAMAAARSTRDVAEQKLAWRAAATLWQSYLEQAESAAEPWVPNARRHLARCERERADLEKTKPRRIKPRAAGSASGR